MPDANFTPLFGWSGERHADKAWQDIGASFQPFKIAASAIPSSVGKTVRAWDVWRNVLGRDLARVIQATGDCFPAGAMVLMADGSEKPIQEVSVGDVVVSHFNKPRSVLGVIRKPYSGSLVNISSKRFRRVLTATPDHGVVRTVRGGGQGVYKKPNQQAWDSIGSVATGDCLLFPNGLADTSEYVTIDCSVFNSHWHSGLVVRGCINDRSNTRGGLRAAKYQIPKSIRLDENLGRLIGLFLAEGSNEGHRIRFSFSSDEMDTLVAESQSLIKRIFGLDSSVAMRHKNKSCAVVTCSSGAVSRFFKSLISGNVYSKAVPPVVLRSPITVRLACLRGWLDGDGHLDKEGRTTGVTSSPQLAETMSRLSMSCGICPSTNIRKKSAHQRVSARAVEFATQYQDAIWGGTSIPKKKRLKTISFANGHGIPVVRLLDTEMSEGMVYCLEVEEDHSFIVNGFAVHNCVGASMNDVAMAQQCVDILSGDRETFEPLLLSFQYAYSRVVVGKNQLRGGAGSVGSWMAKAATTGGFLSASAQGAPAYSGRLSDRWGDDRDYNGITFRQFMDVADDHPVDKAIRVTNWTQLKDAVCNLNFGTIASSCGYEMKPRGGERGFHKPSGTWQHQMSILAISDDWIGIGNQWGDQMGRLVDLITGEAWPIGMLRVTREDFEKYHFKSSAECFVYSGFRGFVDNSSLTDGFLF